jgi:hypothetical protein
MVDTEADSSRTGLIEDFSGFQAEPGTRQEDVHGHVGYADGLGG